MGGGRKRGKIEFSWNEVGKSGGRMGKEGQAGPVKLNRFTQLLIFFSVINLQI